MIDVLTNLYNCAPGMWREFLFAVITLHVNLAEFSDECLFHFSLIIEFLLHSEFDLDAF